MGIDLKHGGRAIGKKHRTEPKSENVYIRLLFKVRAAPGPAAAARVVPSVPSPPVPSRSPPPPPPFGELALPPSLPPLQLYSFLARRTDAGFNGVVLKRLMMSRVNRPPLGLARVARYMSKYSADKVAVIVGTVTDDVRLIGSTLPKLRIAALRFTAGARARIEKAGGECLTFDQLAMQRPTGTDTVLLRGRRTARVATRYFGVPGAPGSGTRPRVRSEGRKVSPPPAPARPPPPARAHAPSFPAPRSPPPTPPHPFTRAVRNGARAPREPRLQGLGVVSAFIIFFFSSC